MLCIHWANGRWCYIIMSCLIGWAQNDPCGPWKGSTADLTHLFPPTPTPTTKWDLIFIKFILLSRILFPSIEQVTSFQINTSRLGGTYMHHWNWVIIGSGNGLMPVCRQAITWINDDLLSIRLFGTKFSKIFVKIKHFHWQSSIWKYCLTLPKWQPSCLSLTKVQENMGQVMEVQLSCYLVLLSVDSKTR